MDQILVGENKRTIGNWGNLCMDWILEILREVISFVSCDNNIGVMQGSLLLEMYIKILNIILHICN